MSKKMNSIPQNLIKLLDEGKLFSSNMVLHCILPKVIFSHYFPVPLNMILIISWHFLLFSLKKQIFS